MKSRKGFTITELVIVIAVIAILAAVLIPTFSGIIKKAENSAITQETRAALTVLQSEKNGNIPEGAYIIYKDANQEIWFKYDKNAGKLSAALEIADVNTAKGYAGAADEYYAKQAGDSKVITYGDPAVKAQTVAWTDLSKNIEIFINVG